MTGQHQENRSAVRSDLSGTQEAVKHTPTPWRVEMRASTRIVAGQDDTVATTGCQGDLQGSWQANAAFIVRAANAHDALREALWNARCMLTAYGSDVSHLTEEDVERNGVDKVHWTMLRQIDDALALTRGAAS